MKFAIDIQSHFHFRAVFFVLFPVCSVCALNFVFVLDQRLEVIITNGTKMRGTLSRNENGDKCERALNKYEHKEELETKKTSVHRTTNTKTKLKKYKAE